MKTSDSAKYTKHSTERQLPSRRVLMVVAALLIPLLLYLLSSIEKSILADEIKVVDIEVKDEVSIPKTKSSGTYKKALDGDPTPSMATLSTEQKTTSKNSAPENKSANTTIAHTPAAPKTSTSWTPSSPIATGAEMLEYRTKNGTIPPWFNSLGGVRNTIPLSMVVIPGGNVPILWCPNAKAGTTTIYHALRSLIQERCYYNCPDSAWRQFGRTDILRNHIMGQTALSFSVIRNPWDRIRSAYENKITSGSIQRHGVHSFVNFVRHIHRYRNNITMMDNHWEPYNRRCYTSPSDHNKQYFEYTHIFRMEDNFMKDIHALFTEAGNPLEATQNLNVARNVSHSLGARIDYYQRAAREANVSLGYLSRMVFQTFQKDIEAWNYSFGVYN